MLPTCTNEAISYSINKMVLLPILDIKQKYNLPMIITGGDGEFLAKLLNEKYDKFLIFKAMQKKLKSL